MAQSPGKGSNLEDCKTSCQNNADCKSITLLKNGWCSHYSTPCTNHKSNNKAVSMRLDTPMNRGTWVDVGSKIECDASAGEIYIDDSPGKLGNIEQCKKSCVYSLECQSITYLNTGWCSHYSTPCTNRRSNNKAVSMRWDTSGWFLICGVTVQFV